MFNNYLKLVLSFCLVVLVSGCASKGLTFRSYVEDKPRVDQDTTGNAGYLQGTSKVAENQEKTRKVFVFELNKEPKVMLDSPNLSGNSTTTTGSLDVKEAQKNVQAQPRIEIPKFDDVQSAPVEVAPVNKMGPEEDQSYTVEKDDTLQKISKKFYGSYGKWTKIYELNKTVIKDPNFLKPGIVITIPKI